MFKRKRIQKFINRLHRIYDRKFLHIESVLNSCVTFEQLRHSARWASAVIGQYKQYEEARADKLYRLSVYIDINNKINKHFGLEQEIINLMFNRNITELKKYYPKDTEEMVGFKKD